MSVAVTTVMPLKVSVDGLGVRLNRAAAMAGPADKARSARVHVETGNAYFNLEKYKEAIAEFEQAYLDKQDPAIFFNIGECHRLLGNSAEAIRFLRRFLQETHNHPNRVKAEDRLADLEQASVAPPPAPVPPPAPRPPAPVAPLAAAGAPVPPLASTPIAPLPAAAPPPVAPAPVSPLASGPVEIAAAPAPERTSSTPVYRQWWFWTGLGAVVVAGVILGLAVSASPSRPGCPAGVVCQ